jgi:hypothetical protein
MNMVFVFDESEVAGLECAAEALSLRFSAASVRHDATDGFLMPLVMTLHGATLHEGSTGDGIGALASGVLRSQVDGRDQAWKGSTLPWACAQALELELVFRNGTRWLIKAQSMACSPGPQSRFVTSYAC